MVSFLLKVISFLLKVISFLEGDFYYVAVIKITIG